MPVTIRRRAAALVALALAAIAVLPAPRAGAVDTAKPTPCAGMLETDAAGDQSFSQSGLGSDDPSSKKTPDNTDITGVFFNERGGVLTANLQIKNLDKKTPPPSDAQGGIWYYVVYRVDNTVWFVRAANATGGDIAYAYGTIDGNGVYTTVGDTKGAFFEGPDGIVQIDVPADAGGKPGTLLGGVVGTVDYIQGADDAVGINNHADTAPDNGTVTDPNGESYTVADCPAGAPAVTTTGGTAAPPAAQTTAPSQPALTSLPFRASLTIGSARKARKGRTLRFKVNATQAITDLRLTLKASSGHGPVLATGSAKSLQGLKTLSLKLKRALKKGRYSLIATGVVDGKRLRAGQQVRVT